MASDISDKILAIHVIWTLGRMKKIILVMTLTLATFRLFIFMFLLLVMGSRSSYLFLTTLYLSPLASPQWCRIAFLFPHQQYKKGFVSLMQ